MRNNDDPIQEMKPFRRGIDNLNENDGINSKYSNDLHNCSNDLSDRGSIKEEFEHAKFANQKREEIKRLLDFKYQGKSNYGSNNRVKKAKNPIAVLISIIIVFSIVSDIVFSIIGSIEEATGPFEDAGSSYEETYYDEEKIENQEQLFKELKSNIEIMPIMLEDNRILLEVNNNNSEVFNNVKIQTIFYDAENRPVLISENQLDNLFNNGKQYCELTEIPETYERFEFLLTQPYLDGEEQVKNNDVVLNVIENGTDYEVKITNNSLTKIDNVEVVMLYYKDNEIVDMSSTYIYDLGVGRTVTDDVYNYKDNDEYDEIKFFVNDIVIY